jgi:hypothetical protein
MNGPGTPRRRDDATPQLLLAFLAGTLAMVLAIAELGRADGDWVDFVAIGLLLALGGLVLTLIGRELGEQAQPGDHDAKETAGR